MIQLEYDVPTSGVRITASFVVLDACACATHAGENSFEKMDGRNKAPSTLNNLKHVRVFLDAAIKRREEQE